MRVDEFYGGGLYTLFLHSPLSAFCLVTNVVDVPIHLWDKCLAYIDRFLTEASRLVTMCRGVGEHVQHVHKLGAVHVALTNFALTDMSFLSFLGDDFLRLLLCRHIFSCVVLKIHKNFRQVKKVTRPSLLYLHLATLLGLVPPPTRRPPPASPSWTS